MYGDAADERQRPRSRRPGGGRDAGQQLLQLVALPVGEPGQDLKRRGVVVAPVGGGEQRAAGAGLAVHAGQGRADAAARSAAERVGGQRRADRAGEGGVAAQAQLADLLEPLGSEGQVLAALGHLPGGRRQLERLGAALDAVERVTRQRPAAGDRDTGDGHDRCHRAGGQRDPALRAPALRPGRGCVQCACLRGLGVGALHGGDREQPGPQRLAVVRPWRDALTEVRAERVQPGGHGDGGRVVVQPAGELFGAGAGAERVHGRSSCLLLGDVTLSGAVSRCNDAPPRPVTGRCPT